MESNKEYVDGSNAGVPRRKFSNADERVQISFFTSKTFNRRLKEAAEREETSKSEIIQRVVDDYLTKSEQGVAPVLRELPNDVTAPSSSLKELVQECLSRLDESNSSSVAAQLSLIISSLERIENIINRNQREILERI